MTIQYASDLHLEFSENKRCLRQNPLIVSGDILLLAGDISVLSRPDVFPHHFFDWCDTHYSHTLIVPGNHEFYGGYDLEPTLHGTEIKQTSRVRYLCNKSIVLGDTEFFFTTLWAPVQERDFSTVEQIMTDCRRIRIDGRQFSAADYAPAHYRCLVWLKTALLTSSATHKVVVTHHCPISAEDPRYAGNGASRAFIAPLEDFIATSDIDYWIFGHTHYNAPRGTIVERTTLLCNQMGYLSTARGGEPGFRLDASFTL